MRNVVRTLFLPLAALSFTVAACDDPTEVDPHAAAEGVAIVVGAEEIYRYMLDDGLPVPTLTLTVGAHETAIILLDHDGNPLLDEHEEGEEEEEIQVVIGDPAILTWTPEAETGEVHEHVELHGELNALQPGSTSMEVCLPHGDHCDFDVDIPVQVEAAQ